MKLQLLGILTVISLNLFSQNLESNYQYELEVSYGLISGHQAQLSLENSSISITGPAFISGRYYAKDWLAIGAIIGVDNTSSNIGDAQNVTEAYWNNSIVLASQFRFRYINKKNFQMYTGLNAGLRFVDEKYENDNVEMIHNNETRFAMHVNLYGIRVGRKLGGVLELGFGNQGILNFGIAYQL